MQNSDKRGRKSAVNGGLYNTISRNFSTKKHSQLSQIKSEEKIPVQNEIHEMFNKGAILDFPNYLEGEFISYLFSRREKSWGKPTSNKLEIPKSFYKLPALKDGRFALSSQNSKKGDYMYQLDLKDVCFSVPLNPVSCSISLVRETLRVSLTLPITKNSCEITQNFNSHVRPNTFDKSYNRRNINSQRHSNLLPSTTRVCIEFKGISLGNYTNNRVFKGDIRFISHDPVSAG